MKRFYTILILLFAFLFASAQTEIKNGVVVDHGAEKIIKQTVSKLKKDTPLSFSVDYDISNGSKTTEKGKASFLSSNDKYRVISNAFEDYCDGKTLWHYDKKSNEVEITEVEDGKSLFNFVKIIDTYTKSFRPKLIRKDYLGKTQVNIIDLTPQKRSSITKVRLWIATSSNIIVKMQVNINDGSKNTYSFSNYKSKVTTNNSDFTFPKAKYPKVKQVDLR